MRGLKLGEVYKPEPGGRRTPPGVRGLKQRRRSPHLKTALSRTPPGVRGLKPDNEVMEIVGNSVAPRPGCVD